MQKSTVFVMGFSLLLSVFMITSLEFADAAKSEGTTNSEILSDQVCGEDVCQRPMTIAEKIIQYLHGTLPFEDKDATMKDNTNIFQKGMILQKKAEENKKAEMTSLIWSAVIEIKTSDKLNAGTNNQVYVKLNDDNITWLDYPGNDFEREQNLPYELLLEQVNSLKDIEKLEIGKTGIDGWCIDEINLFINKKHMFSKTFEKCHWLDDNPDKGITNSIMFGAGKLRSHPSWSPTEMLNPPFFITGKDLEKKVKTAIGNNNRYSNSFWCENCGVTLTTDEHFQVDTLHKIRKDNTNTRIEYSFDIKPFCNDDGMLEFKMPTRNFEVTGPISHFQIDPETLVMGSSSKRIEKALSDFGESKEGEEKYLELMRNVIANGIKQPLKKIQKSCLDVQVDNAVLKIIYE